MKFLVDAQLPRRLASWLNTTGHDAVHTLDLPHGNRTPDTEITLIADRDGRVVITKDADFVDSHILQGRPERLLLISTGNLSNAGLSELLAPLFPSIVAEFETAVFLEAGRNGLVIRG